MAKYIDAEKIRAEIERRKKENMYYELPMTIGRYYEDRDLLSFLDTLEELDIELINRSWYMEGYHDCEFGYEPKWIIKTGEGGPRYEENPKYGQMLEAEQKPVEYLDKDKVYAIMKKLVKLAAFSQLIPINSEEYKMIDEITCDIHKLLDYPIEQKPAEKQDYSGLNELEQAIHRGFLCAGVENVPVNIIKETAQDCLAHLPAEWSEDFDKEVENVHKRYPEVSYAKLTRIAYHFSKWANSYKGMEWSEDDEVRDKKFNTDYEVKIEPAAGFDLGCINVYREGKLVGQYVEPKEEKKLPEDLEEAAKKYDEAESWRWEAPKYPRREAFEAGAEWQKNRLKTNSISAGYNQTDEEYDREMDFATSIIEKEHRQPTFSDAINYGIKLQKEQMMKDAIECELVCLKDRLLAVLPMKEFQWTVGDKIKIIIVKEEEQ